MMERVNALWWVRLVNNREPIATVFDKGGVFIAKLIVRNIYKTVYFHFKVANKFSKLLLKSWIRIGSKLTFSIVDVMAGLTKTAQRLERVTSHCPTSKLNKR